VIAAAYLGDIEFDPQATQHWFAGGRALQTVCDRMICFIHPVDSAMTDEIEGEVGSDSLQEFVAGITAELGIEVLPWRGYELTPEDFLDVNHMNARGGREKLSRQLAARILS